MIKTARLPDPVFASANLAFSFLPQPGVSGPRHRWTRSTSAGS